MTEQQSDPLLTSARVLLGLFMGALIFVLVLVSIGWVAILTVQRGQLAAEIQENGLAPETYWAVVASVAAIVPMLLLAIRFVKEFMEIVASVDAGDPFIHENADRLARMGWLALAVQVVGIPIGIAAIYLERVTGKLRAELGISAGGVLLVLTLFILARIFRKGAEMREELEGTV